MSTTTTRCVCVCVCVRTTTLHPGVHGRRGGRQAAPDRRVSARQGRGGPVIIGRPGGVAHRRGELFQVAARLYRVRRRGLNDITLVHPVCVENTRLVFFFNKVSGSTHPFQRVAVGFFPHEYLLQPGGCCAALRWGCVRRRGRGRTRVGRMKRRRRRRAWRLCATPTCQRVRRKKKIFLPLSRSTGVKIKNKAFSLRVLPQ